MGGGRGGPATKESEVRELARQPRKSTGSRWGEGVGGSEGRRGLQPDDVLGGREWAGGGHQRPPTAYGRGRAQVATVRDP